MKLIVGLGNPGKGYSFHRHNIGFLVVDELARRYDISVRKRSFKALVGAGSIEEHLVILAKPQTFMNLSGESVAPLLGYYRLEARDLVVIHDDIDLDLGRIKTTKASGDAGHRGVRSIIEKIGTRSFCRVRLGVGAPPDGVDAADYVLSSFDKSELEKKEALINSAVKTIEDFLLSSRVVRELT